MKILFIALLTIMLYTNGYCQISTGLIPMDRSAYNRIASNLPSTPITDLPSSVDLSHNLPPIGNQNPQNSCVAWAVAYYARSYYEKSQSNNWNFYNSGSLNPNTIFSPSYIYNQINGGQDRGSNFYSALVLLQNQGVSTLATMPYSHFLMQPNAQARNEASRFKIKSFRRLGEIMSPLLDAKEQLSKGHPIIVSAKTDLTYFDRGFQQQNLPNPFIWRSIGQIDRRLNHAILLVGYDDQIGAFKFVNSWGLNWGNSGFGWISYSIFPEINSESFVINPVSDSQIPVNTIVYKDKQYIDAEDRSIGFNLLVTVVNHMNSMTHPHVHFNDRHLRIQGAISLPANAGKQAQIVVYFYKAQPNGAKGEPVRSLNRSVSLPNGNLVTFTPPLPLNNQPVNNLGWYADLKYIAFDLPRGQFGPIVHNLIAEPALLIDDYPVRIGQQIRFVIAH